MRVGISGEGDQAGYFAAKARSAATNGSAGGVAMPAPIMRGALPWAIAVLIFGTVPVRTTLRMSMPVGVPASSSAAIGNRRFAPTQISCIARDVATASANDVAPTILSTAGDAAIAM